MIVGLFLRGSWPEVIVLIGLVELVELVGPIWLCSWFVFMYVYAYTYIDAVRTDGRMRGGRGGAG